MDYIGVPGRLPLHLQFNPWHALAAHRPIGSIMRVRKAAYAMSKQFRAQRNDMPIAEPRDLAMLAPLVAL